METRAGLFGAFSEDYDRFRPGYPEEAWDLLGLDEGNRVADLGAGTGRAALALAARGLRVTAVEPDPAMAAVARAQGARKGGAIAVVEAPAEHTGLGPESQHAVVAAQAYHWFEIPAANLEIARILRPGAVFAALWNDRVVDGVPWMEQFEQLIARYNPAHRRDYRTFDVEARLREGGVFASVESHQFECPWTVAASEFLGFSRTLSYVRTVLTPADLGRFEGEVRRLVKETHGGKEFTVPMVTNVTLARKPESR